MLSLILTVVAIALVAVLAVVTVFYGGDIYSAQRAKVAAATLANQAQQIYAASQAYYLEQNVWPANTAILVADGRYLRNAPTPPASSYAKIVALLSPISFAYADSMSENRELPPLKFPLNHYLQDNATLTAEFGVTDLDASEMRSQLAARDASQPGFAQRVLQIMQDEQAKQAAGSPSVLDFSWPAAASQSSLNRYLTIPAKVSLDTCKAVNLQWRESDSIPASYSSSNGATQCYGTPDAGYTFLWLAPGTSPSLVSPPTSSPVTPAAACSPELMVNGVCAPDQAELLGLHMSPIINVGNTVLLGAASKVVTVINRSASPQDYSLSFDEWSDTNHTGSLRDFSISDDTCSGKITAPGASCRFTITWASAVESYAELTINLSSTVSTWYPNAGFYDTFSERAYAYAATSATATTAFDLEFNPGQPGGSFLYTDKTATLAGQFWGALAEAGFNEPIMTASFCPKAGDTAAMAATATITMDYAQPVPSLGSWGRPMTRNDGVRCFIFFDGALPAEMTTAGVYPVEILTKAGVFRSTMVYKAKP